MSERILLGTIESIKIYQQNMDIPNSNGNVENGELYQKIKEDVSVMGDKGNNKSVISQNEDIKQYTAEHSQKVMDGSLNENKICILDIDDVKKETDIKVLIAIANNPNSNLQQAAIEQARELLVTGKIKMDELGKTGLVPALVGCLNSVSSQIQLAAIRTLFLITVGSLDDTKMVVEANAISVLRDKCFELEFLPSFFKVANNDEYLASTVAFTMFNMCRYKSKPVSMDVIQQMLPILEKFYSSNDPEVISPTFEVIALLTWLKEGYIPLINEHKFIQKMVGFLNHSNQEIVHAALSTIERMTEETEEQTELVVDVGVIPKLIKFVDSSDDKTKELSLSILGNIAADRGSYRDQCIQLGLVPKMLKLFSSESTVEQLKNNIDLIRCLCQSNAHPISIDTITELLPLLKQFIHHEDVEIIYKAVLIFWCIVYQKDAQKNQLLIENDIFKEIIPFLKHSDEHVQSRTSRVIINIVFGTSQQVQHLIDNGVMDYIPLLLNHKDDNIQSRILFFLRKIIWKPHAQIQAIINANLIPSIIPLLDHENVLVQKEAIWTISNFAIGARPLLQINYLMKHDFISAFCKGIYSPEIFNVKLIVKGINAILRKCDHEKFDEVCDKILESGAVDKMKELEANTNTDEEILSAVREIVRNHFSESQRQRRRRNVNTFLPKYMSK
uniref:Importin subunit alpha n=1 Tax=Panagrolaimus sp. PS1159 TaxID=55785 RepID=A0AC35FKM3_9BILA